jgi:hypothetical protein
MVEWLKDVPAKAAVLIKAWPTFAASITAVLAVLAQDVVPHLPGGVAVKVLAYMAAAAAAVAAVSAAVARVTPILFPEEKGILPLPEAPAMEFDSGVLRIGSQLDRDDVTRLEREWKAKYAPGAAATGDDDTGI